MPTVATYNQSGVKVGEIQLNDAVFGVEVNEAVMHQAVVRQLSNERLGTHATKTRGMVRGGGRKPWKQKGTGRARSGSSFNVGDAKVLFITEGDVNVERSARNIQGVKALACEGMNIFDLLHYDKLFITKGAVAKIEEVLG